MTMSSMRFNPSMTPLIVPPRSRSITGYVVMMNRSPAAITSEPRKYTMLSPSVCASGMWMTCTPSPLKKWLSFIDSWWNVSVGHAPSGVDAWVPVGALMRLSTFSYAKIAAPCPASAMSPATLPPVNVRPDLASRSLPPVWSACACVLMM